MLEVLGPVVRKAISANPGLNLKKTIDANPGLALITFRTTGPWSLVKGAQLKTQINSEICFSISF